MADNADETIDSTNDTTEEVVKTDEVEETDDQSESEDLSVLQEKNKRLFERAKKAEAEAKLLKANRLKEEEQAKAKVEVKTEARPSEKQDGLTPKDLYALMEAKVPQDDVEVVSDYAAFKKISVAEALKSSVVKTELAQRVEQRTTAEATNTSNARRGTSKPSNEQILSNVEKGKFPENPEDLADARFESRLKK